jgi:asparaginyl-tRNA synthetase
LPPVSVTVPATCESMAPISEIRGLGQHDGSTATVRGWVQTTRTHGKVAFVVIRDGTGMLQCVVVKKEVSGGGGDCCTS